MRSSALVVATSAAAVVLLLGCERPAVTRTAIDEHAMPAQELEFFESLESKQVASNDDVLHAFFLLTDGEDQWGSYRARVSEAVRRGWVPDGFDSPSNEGAPVGMVARIACMTSRLKGGFTMSVFGPIPRYAVRELSNAQVLVGKKENQSFSGMEFVDFLTRLDRLTNIRNIASQSSVHAEEGGDTGSASGETSGPRLQPPVGRLE